MEHFTANDKKLTTAWHTQERRPVPLKVPCTTANTGSSIVTLPVINFEAWYHDRLRQQTPKDNTDTQNM
jgi:hypothetical protein